MSKTIQLLMPQWQGGNNAVAYPFGARLLAWLAPESGIPLIEVPVERYNGSVAIDNGIVERQALMKQLRAARHIIDAHSPERIIVYGGDCLVSQAPFAYLNEYYNGELGVLWVDAHPDVTTPKDFAHAHAMVLGNLLGEGDAEFAAEVKLPIKPENVMYAGVDEVLAHEAEVIKRLGLRTATSHELEDNSGPVLDWIRDRGIKKLAVHLDLDVLDPNLFRSLLFNNPNADSPVDAFSGKMTINQLTRLIGDVSVNTDVVGLSFAEYMPWDCINIKNMLEQFSFIY